MQTELRNRWVGGFFKKKKLVHYLAGQKVYMLHFFITNSNKQNFIART